MLPENVFIDLIDEGLQRRIAKANDLNKDAMDALQLLMDPPISKTKELENWTLDISNGYRVLLYKGRSYIPKDIDLQRDIVKMFHDPETAGHPGELGTFNAVQQHFWWPGLQTFVKNYVRGCGICQQFKIDRTPTKPAYIPTEGAKST